MLRSPRANVVESDEGYTVEVLGRTGIIYKEGDYVMFVDSEVLAPPYGIAVFKGSIRRWQEPHQLELIDDSKRDQIIENIRCAVVDFWGSTLEITT